MLTEVEEGYMSLSAYLGQFQEMVEQAEGFPSWVVCELANVSWNRGHCYLEMVESSAQGATLAKARGTIWYRKATILNNIFREGTGDVLQAGIKVMLYVQLQFSSLYGLSLNVLDINPSYTLGDMEANKQATLKRLAQEGLIDKNKELSVPELPYRIAVISADGAAGYGDFIKHLNESGIQFEVELFEAAMQGADAPQSIASAFERVNARSGEFDVAVLIRGGGSNLDLVCFNDYLVASSVALCYLPVISGVGHERDNHICDEVACIRVKTPTGAADFLIGKFAEAYQNLSDLITRLSDAVGDVFIEADDFLHRALLRISSALSSFTETRNQHLAGLKFRLENVVSNQIIMRQHFLEKLQAKMEEAHPRRILDKGYGIILIEGNKVFDISSIREGSKLTIVMQDGRVSLTAADVKVSKE